jgi:hypothetical protein
LSNFQEKIEEAKQQIVAACEEDLFGDVAAMQNV